MMESGLESGHPAPTGYPAPDLARIDRLMEAAGLDALVVTSKHNVQYLMGGYRFIFFAAMDAIGHSRYLPVLVYARGRPGHAAVAPERWALRPLPVLAHPGGRRGEAVALRAAAAVQERQ